MRKTVSGTTTWKNLQKKKNQEKYGRNKIKNKVRKNIKIQKNYAIMKIYEDQQKLKLLIKLM